MAGIAKSTIANVHVEVLRRGAFLSLLDLTNSSLLRNTKY
jgi:hypothetical protein